MNWRLMLSGALALALLEATVSSQQAAARAGGLLTGIAGVIERILSPTVAAIPDLRKHGGAGPPLSEGEGDAGPANPTVPGSLVPPDWTTSPKPPQYV